MSDQTSDQTEDDDKTVLDPAGVAAELLDDWRYLAGALHARFDTGDFATGLRLVDAIGESAEAVNHHPDVDLRYPHVSVRLTSHDVGGVTMRDVRLAREIGDHAGKVGAKARTDLVRVLEIALDTPSADDVAPFWAAVLGLPAPDAGTSVLDDPDGRLPTLWFQQAEQAEATETPSQRFHLDVIVAPEHAERRVREVVEAGGTLVSDARAPSFWVLADAQGNKACICTAVGSTEEVPVGD